MRSKKEAIEFAIKFNWTAKDNEYEKTLQKERSLFISLIKTIYQFAKPLGFEDPWIEALLAKYNEYQNDQSSDQNDQAS